MTTPEISPTDTLIETERHRVASLSTHVRDLLPRIEAAAEGVLDAGERAELDEALADARDALTRAGEVVGSG